jgi:hypothetical protein
VAEREALYFLALSRAQQQDIRWQGFIVANKTDGKPRRVAFAIGHRGHWAHRDRAGCVYRRLSTRVSKAKAITATARKIAVSFRNALRHGMDYADPGASY